MPCLASLITLRLAKERCCFPPATALPVAWRRGKKTLFGAQWQFLVEVLLHTKQKQYALMQRLMEVLRATLRAEGHSNPRAWRTSSVWRGENPSTIDHDCFPHFRHSAPWSIWATQPWFSAIVRGFTISSRLCRWNMMEPWPWSQPRLASPFPVTVVLWGGYAWRSIDDGPPGCEGGVAVASQGGTGSERLHAFPRVGVQNWALGWQCIIFALQGLKHEPSAQSRSSRERV